MIQKIYKSEKQLISEIIIIAEIILQELRINSIPEIRNRCNVWEQAFHHYCVDPLVFDRWGYM